MNMNNEEKKLENTNPQFVTDTSGDSLTSFKGLVEAKFKDVNYILLGVVLILIVMVATLIIDSFHINSATYREYSEKIETLNVLRNQNKELLEQNKENQELIILQQKQILKLLDK